MSAFLLISGATAALFAFAAIPGSSATPLTAPPGAVRMARPVSAPATPAALPSALSIGLPAVNPDTTTPAPFSIPSQPLADALGEYARQAGVRIVANGAALRGVSAAEVRGVMTSTNALRRLLEGTGLTGRFTDDATVTIAPAGDADGAPQRLGAVMVTGNAVRGRGYVAQRTFSATKTDTPLRDTPQAVTVVTQELIADQAMTSMADVVRYVPGVTMGQGEGHRDAPTIRGNATTADFYVDGVRDDVQYYRDVYNVDRVEALKGANAMVFGRGGGGGVINRVAKEAQWAPVRAFTFNGGSHAHRRGSLDVGQGLGRHVAVRFNGVVESSDTYRDHVALQRVGINPTAAISLGARTTARMGYEYFSDDRTVDRGIPSFAGAPSPAARSTFFGNPDASFLDARVHAATAVLDHANGRGLTVRNRTRFAHYDRLYQNVYPGAMTADGREVAISAYNNSTVRDNLFNQTDVTMGVSTGSVWHTLLVGAEVGRQASDNFRNTGYFGTATTISVPFDAPTTTVTPEFRQSASDADNRVSAAVASVYAQDQLSLTSMLQAIVGVRYERFALDYRNNRDGAELSRTDAMVSPRGGIVFKPAEPVSFYGSVSVSHLPGSGDQFASLTATTQALAPERFTNTELGAKWDVREDLAVTAAAYRLDRTNTRAVDPADPSRQVQTGEQRTTGWELGVSGRPLPSWAVAGGVASQRAVITTTTAAAPAGRTIPLVPATTASLWNKVDVTPRVGVGVGVVHQGKSYAAIDNTVTLPAFTRTDAALFLSLVRDTRLQVNVENVFGTTYYATSHGNNNIMPGAPTSVKVSVQAAF